MSREAKLGLFAIVVLALAIWGYKYLKGQNILSESYTFKTEYDDVTQLTISSPVLINGLNVGSVTSIKVNENDLSKMVVTFNLEKDYKVPKNAIAYQINNGLVNGKAVSIKFDRVCSGGDCAQSGDMLEGKVMGLIGSMLGGDDVTKYVGTLSDELGTAVNKLGAEGSEGTLNETIRNLNLTMQNVESLSKTTDALVKRSYTNLSKSIENVGLITQNLAQNNAQITSLLGNLNSITTDIKTAKLSQTISTSNATLEESKVAVKQLQATLTDADDMVQNLNAVIKKMDEGQGSLSQLLNDKELYNNLSSTSENLSLLLQDMRLNPHRYMNISVFGRKSKKYVKPEDDPAYKN